MTPETRFILVRHGQTAFNLEDRIRGRTDVPLDETGIAQARATASALSAERIDAVFSSPLSRAVQTAEPVAKARGIAVLSSEQFHDFDFGEWQGLPRAQVRERWPDLYSVYERDPASFQAPSGETLRACLDRSVSGLDMLAARRPGDTILIASHAVVCILALCGILGLGPEKYWNIKQGNCAVNKFHFGPRGWVVECINDTSHLRLDA